MLREEEAKEKIRRLEIGKEIDHYALGVYIRGEMEEGRREKKEEKGMERDMGEI